MSDIHKLILLWLQAFQVVVETSNEAALAEEELDILFFDTPFRSSRKVRRLVGKVNGGIGRKKPYKVQVPKRAVQQCILNDTRFDRPGTFYNYFGVFAKDFEEKIFPQLAMRVGEPRKKQVIKRTTKALFTPRSRILIVLHLLKSGKPYQQVAHTFRGCSVSFVQREVQHTLPKLVETLQFISFPKEIWTRSKALEVVGCIDCTPHYCIRIHPRAGDLYRGDHCMHGLTVQLITGLDGSIYSVVVLLGHNNDQGSFNTTNVGTFLGAHKIKLAADLGYSNSNLVTPKNVKSNLNHEQLKTRSIVEIIFGFVKTYLFGRNKCTFRSVALISTGLLAIYQLAALNINLYPIRSLAHADVEKIPVDSEANELLKKLECAIFIPNH